jgi:hypothetical protein
MVDILHEKVILTDMQERVTGKDPEPCGQDPRVFVSTRAGRNSVGRKF